MILTTLKMLSIIQADGWYQVRQTGSHRHFKHPTKAGTITIPFHGKNKMLSHFEVNSILKQAKIKL